MYCSFLEVTSTRYSALSLSEVAPKNMTLSHDSISRWLANAKVQPKNLWEIASKEIAGHSGILAFDDVVINKSRSQKMELVNWQYSGAEHGIVKGIGVVNALWQTSKDEYTPIDYRIWNPPEDGKTKNNHFREMLSSAKTRGLEPEMVVADSWYSSLDNLKSIRSHGWDWVMGLRGNRLVNKPHIQICKLDIPDEGLKVHLKGYGWIKLFRFVGKNGRTDYIGSSRLDLTREQVKAYFERRWSIEVMHRELKQNCGFGRCQANSGRAGRNHIGLSFIALVRKHTRRRRDLTTPYQQNWFVIKPAIQRALATAICH
ncbi:MAG: transposase [Candidatus Bathyarchaeota archaeon]|nr:transposase [Candidatus Termiticorpusculum sp.]